MRRFLDTGEILQDAAFPAAASPGYETAVKEEMEASVRVEPGVLAIRAVAEADNPSRLRLFERPFALGAPLARRIESTRIQ